MTTLDQVSDWIEQQFPKLLAEHDVPGAAIAVAVGDEVVDGGSGVLSLATGVDVNADTLFQIGSITKVWTTTLVMQLVDEGLVDLDAPVQRYLPDFTVADKDAAAVMTVRQLLDHTAGFEGDIFTDTGPGDDAIEKFVATLGNTAQLFPPGERFSYNNAGFCVLGRIVEVVRGTTFDAALRERLFQPLGLTHAATDANQAILHRAAVGHIRPNADAELVPAPIWSLVRSNAPAGAMLSMRPRDLLAFARMHVAGGTAADGTQVLSAESVAAMQQSQVTLPDLGMMGDEWGLGWEIFRMGGTTVIGHDGGTIGQSAFLRIVPEKGVAVALLTNGGNTMGLYRAVFEHLLREVADLELKTLPVPPESPEQIDATRFLGTYSCDVVDVEVAQDGDGRIWMTETPKGIFVELGGEVERTELVHLRDDTLIAVKADRGMHVATAFVGDDGDGHALYAHSGRAIRRAGA